MNKRQFSAYMKELHAMGYFKAKTAERKRAEKLADRKYELCTQAAEVGQSLEDYLSCVILPGSNTWGCTQEDYLNRKEDSYVWKWRDVAALRAELKKS